jgi:hypothetical protein
MPLLVKLSPVGPPLQAAYNAGTYATGQENQQAALRSADFGLRAQGQAANQALAFRGQDLQEQHYADQQAQGDEELQYRYDALDAQNQRAYDQNTFRGDLQAQRSQDAQELLQLRLAAQAGQIDQRGAQRLNFLEQKSQYDQQRDAQRFDFQGGQQQMNRDSREGIASDNRDQRYYDTDQRTQQGQQRLDQQGQYQQQRLQQVDAARQAQDERFGARMQEYVAKAQTDQQVRVLLQQRHQAAALAATYARNFDAGKAAEYTNQVGQIDQLLGNLAGGGGGGGNPYQYTPPPLQDGVGQVGRYQVPFVPAGSPQQQDGDPTQFDQIPPGDGGGGQGQPVPVRTRQEALALPSGTPFVDPYGVVRVRP